VLLLAVPGQQGARRMDAGAREPPAAAGGSRIPSRV